MKTLRKTKTIEKPAAAARTIDLFKQLAAEYLAPPPQMTVHEWADAYRVLPSTSAVPGQWQTSLVPYMREIMECLSESSPVRDISLMKAAQVSGTESANCWLGYIVHLAPAPTMVVQPTLEVLKSYSQQKIAPMITLCPTIRERVAETKSRDSGNTMYYKEFPGGFLKLSGANSAASLRSMAIKNLFFDEVDAYVEDVEGEGDPIDIAMARTRTFSGSRKVFKCSTPLLRGFSRIEKDFLESDQRRYHVPCPHCGYMHVLAWEHFVIPKNDLGERQPQDAYMVCPDCGGVIEEHHKTAMLENGEWRATCPEKAHPKRRGYHISTLYSPIGWFSWADIAEQWLKAQQDTTRLKAFVNTILGETWAEDGEQLDYESIYETHRVIYEAEIPSSALVITAAVDVQDDRLEYEFKGWGTGKRSWGLEYGVLMGDPRQSAVWEQLDQQLERRFSYLDGTRIGISCTTIDSGGHATDKVYHYCKEREHKRVFAIKGRGGAGIPLVAKPSRSNRIGAALFILGVDTGKDLILARLRESNVEKDGYCYYPMGEDGSPVHGYDLKYFRGLTCEKRMIRYVRGHAKYEWVKPSGARNEPLDLMNYNTAAVEILNPNFEALAALPRAAVAKAQQRQVQRPRSSKRRVLSQGVS